MRQRGWRWPAGALILLALWYAPRLPAVPVCGFRWLSGLPCPLCGMTRALSAMIHGNWNEAVQLHPLSPVAVLTGVALLAGVPGNRIPWKVLLPLFAVYGVARIVTA